MSRMARAIVLISLLLFLSNCHTECSCEGTNPSLSNRKQWKSWLDVTNAKPDAPIATTQTQISNVSRSLAAAKMTQALESYDAELGYRLSTVFQVAQGDVSEGKAAEPDITDVVVDGHYYYIALLDYPADSVNRAAYTQTQGTIPGIAIVDAEDETKPAWIRTHWDRTDEKTKTIVPEPYKIKYYFGTQANVDEHNISRHLRNNGYGTALSCYRLDNPTLELDDNWKPFFTATYAYDDGCAQHGEAYYGETLVVVDAQTGEIFEYALDKPTTEENERAQDIPDWVDQVYSERLIKEWIEHWGYNTENFAKTSDLDRFQTDGNIDTVMNADNTNLVFVAYITSTLKDNSVVGVMLVDPRTARATMHWRTGPEQAMATKKTAVNTIKEAVHPAEYGVEDLTLHTIFGVPTWEGVLTRPAYDNRGRPYGSTYVGTVLLRANHDLKPGNVVWEKSKRLAFNQYEERLYLRQSVRVGSNVLEDKTITATVRKMHQVTIDGDTNFILALDCTDCKGKRWAIPLTDIGDPNTEDILRVDVGDRVTLIYGDPRNRKAYLVRQITVLTN